MRAVRGSIFKRYVLPALCAAAFWAIAACGPWSGAVKPLVVMEAGGAVPDASAFASKPDDADGASYATDIWTLDLNTVGDKSVAISLHEKIYKAVLRVSDTTPPTGAPVENTVVSGRTPDAAAFVTDIRDATEVQARFRKAPDFTRPGARDVTVTLEDAGGNKTDIVSRLYVVGVKPAVSAEAGAWETLDPRVFLDDPDSVAGGLTVAVTRGISPSWLSLPGEYEIGVSLDGVEFTAALSVTDTTPPSAVPAARATTPGQPLEPLDFVTDVRDASPVTAKFAKTPDFTTLGEREAVILLEDAFGNRAELTAGLAVRESVVPPVISGAADITLYLGDNVAYRKGVLAKDAKGKTVEVSVDSGAVNLNRSGSYPVVYSASDADGNTASVTVTLTVLDVDEPSVNKLADDILREILTDGMTDTQKIESIHHWVTMHIDYQSTGDKDGVVKVAYQGFRYRKGDCYTYYAVSEVLLTRAGIENMRVERVGGRTGHYWNLIYVDDGWYHFDSTPFKTPLYTCIFTEAQAEEYTKLRKDVKNCYVYDKTLYPEVVYSR